MLNNNIQMLIKMNTTSYVGQRGRRIQDTAKLI